MEKIYLKKINKVKLSHLIPKEVKSLFKIFEKEGFKLLLVGGIVRDLLLNKKVQDIDLSVNTEPQKTIQILYKNNIKLLKHSVSYGSITAILSKNSYVEITSLRKDIKTFGRKAIPSFGENFENDAMRRDFTINALYADLDGNVYDYVGGIDDINNYNLKFIGEPQSRIKEDFLRILRFFRFIAYFKGINYDKSGLDACSYLAENLTLISLERKTKEMQKILTNENALQALLLMQKNNVLDKILPLNINFSEFEKITLKEKLLNLSPCFIRRLAALVNYNPSASNFLILNKKENVRFGKLCLNLNINDKFSALNMKYFEGLNIATDILVKSANLDKIKDYKKLLLYLNDVEIKKFPITGDDLLKLGYLKDKKLGEILNKAKIEWLNKETRLNKKEILEFINKNYPV